MTRFVVLATAGLVGVAVAGPQPQATGRFASVDLRPKANHKLADRLGRTEGNTLASLPTGRQAFAGVTFDVQPDVFQLASASLPVEKAAKIEGVTVNRTARKVYFLHGTAFGYS